MESINGTDIGSIPLGQNTVEIESVYDMLHSVSEKCQWYGNGNDIRGETLEDLALIPC